MRRRLGLLAGFLVLVFAVFPWSLGAVAVFRFWRLGNHIESTLARSDAEAGHASARSTIEVESYGFGFFEWEARLRVNDPSVGVVRETLSFSPGPIIRHAGRLRFAMGELSFEGDGNRDEVALLAPFAEGLQIHARIAETATRPTIEGVGRIDERSFDHHVTLRLDGRESSERGVFTGRTEIRYARTNGRGGLVAQVFGVEARRGSATMDAEEASIRCAFRERPSVEGRCALAFHELTVSDETGRTKVSAVSIAGRYREHGRALSDIELELRANGIKRNGEVFGNRSLVFGVDAAPRFSAARTTIDVYAKATEAESGTGPSATKIPTTRRETDPFDELASRARRSLSERVPTLRVAYSVEGTRTDSRTELAMELGPSVNADASIFDLFDGSRISATFDLADTTLDRTARTALESVASGGTIEAIESLDAHTASLIEALRVSSLVEPRDGGVRIVVATTASGTSPMTIGGAPLTEERIAGVRRIFDAAAPPRAEILIRPTRLDRGVSEGAFFATLASPTIGLKRCLSQSYAYSTIAIEGHYAVSASVQRNGTLKRIEVRSPDLTDPNALECFRTSLASMTLPEGSSGAGTIAFEVTLSLAPAAPRDEIMGHLEDAFVGQLAESLGDGFAQEWVLGSMFGAGGGMEDEGTDEGADVGPRL